MEDQLTNQNRKQIRKIMEDPAWAGFEAYIRYFMNKNFTQASIKRGSEFDTIWYAAEQEGGKRLIAQFIREMEEEANKNND